MQLKLVTPTRVLVEEPAAKITAEAANGWFCLLPRHVDFVTALIPGILIYQTPQGEEHLVAVDEGTLVKCGKEVLVSVRSAVVGDHLEDLRATVEQEFRARAAREQETHQAMARLEAIALRRFGQLDH